MEDERLVTKTIEALQCLRAKVLNLVIEDETHPRGCPKKAWLQQTDYFVQELNKVEKQQLNSRTQSLVMCAILLISDFDRTKWNHSQHT